MKYRMVKTSVAILLILITFIGLVSCKPERMYVYDKESQELAHMLTGKYGGISINGGTRDDLMECLAGEVLKFKASLNWVKYTTDGNGLTQLVGYSIGSGMEERTTFFMPGGPTKDQFGSDMLKTIGERVQGDTKGADFKSAWDDFGGTYGHINNTGTNLVLRLQFGADDTEIKMFMQDGGSNSSFGTIKSKDVASGFSIRTYGLNGTWSVQMRGSHVSYGTTDWNHPDWGTTFTDMSAEKREFYQECWYQCWHDGYHNP